MHAEDDFDPLALPEAQPQLAPVIPISPKKTPVKKRPTPQAEEPLPTEPPEFEPAARATRPAPAGRTLPHSVEAEEHLLSCCFLDGADVITKCLEAQITSESFYDSRNGIVFNCLADLRRRGLPTETFNVYEELKRTKQIDQVGGLAFISQVSGRMPTTAQASYFIKTVREYALRREMIRVSTSVVEDAHSTTDALDLAEKCERILTDVLRRAQHVTDIEPMAHAQLTYPTSGDPNVLLGSDDYLGRGGGLLFVSHGGAGKSSFIYGACCTWALGHSFMGIRANGPLRTLMIQAEDSERYMGKLRTSFDFANNSTPEQQAQRDANVIIYHARGINGAPFFALLRRLVEKHAPDLVVINPVYLYAEGDISTPDACQPFLVGLDAINRDQRFGYILVHHTGKPVKKDGKGQRAELEDWETIYQGFGSSFFANWPRCTMLLEPREGKHGKFWLRLGKAGMNAGVTKTVNHGGVLSKEPNTKIGLKYSDGTIMIGGEKKPVIAWLIDEEAKDEPKKNAKDLKLASNAEILAELPIGEEAAIAVAEWERKAVGIIGIGKSAFIAVRTKLVLDGLAKKTAAGLYYRAAPTTQTPPPCPT